jgi:hypothetical protein
MGRTKLVPGWAVAALLAFQLPVQAQGANPELPVSLARIRAGLERPPSVLETSEPSGLTPTFHVEVRAHPVDLRPVEEEPFDPTYGLPSAGELMMGGVQKIVSATANYKRRRAERRARKGVDEAIAAFCAVNDCQAAPPPR